MALAAEAGIRAVGTRLVEVDHRSLLLVERFDRIGLLEGGANSCSGAWLSTTPSATPTTTARTMVSCTRTGNGAWRKPSTLSPLAAEITPSASAGMAEPAVGRTCDLARATSDSSRPRRPTSSTRASRWQGGCPGSSTGLGYRSTSGTESSSAVARRRSRTEMGHTGAGCVGGGQAASGHPSTYQHAAS